MQRRGSIAEIAASLDIIAVQVDQECTIKRCAPNAGSAIVTRAMLQARRMKVINRLA